MEKTQSTPTPPVGAVRLRSRVPPLLALVLTIWTLVSLYPLVGDWLPILFYHYRLHPQHNHQHQHHHEHHHEHHHHHHHDLGSPYGRFPQPKDSFKFLPCTNTTLPPLLDDKDHEQTWANLFDPDPDHWSWGNKTDLAESDDPYAGRGIYLCGYIDVPLDYRNSSDTRITRLAVTKFQVSGLARLDGSSFPGAGTKSNRTLVLEPGGPGNSGLSMVWSSGEKLTQRFTEGKFDALGWDPRGVNSSQPAISCYPYNADRDRWSKLTQQYREVSVDPDAQLRLMDAMNNATFYSCWKRHGDLGRFMTTALVARDLEEIRKSLGEDELTGYLVSYGTGIGQTYVNMFPDSAGRVILDGTEYVRDHRELAGFVSNHLFFHHVA